MPVWDLLEQRTVRIAGAVQESVVDGPGFRYVIFTQGCPLRCKGCHNPQSQPLSGGAVVPLKVLYDEIKQNPLATGITFSGGEPFIQAESLAILARKLRSENYNLWSFSGFTYEKLLENAEHRRFLEQLDILVDGPFVIKHKTLDLAYRGSSNQRIIDVQRSLKEQRVVVTAEFD